MSALGRKRTFPEVSVTTKARSTRCFDFQPGCCGSGAGPLSTEGLIHVNVGMLVLRYKKSQWCGACKPGIGSEVKSPGSRSPCGLRVRRMGVLNSANDS